LKEGAVIGTSSLRRGAQIRHARPDVRIVSLRGNVGTRLAALQAGGIDATLLAVAGLRRLGLDHVPHVLLDPLEMPPAVGQGALAITARAGDTRVMDAFARIADPVTLIETCAERQFLADLDGSCRTAIAGYASLGTDNVLHLLGEKLSDDGRRRWRAQGMVKNPDVTRAKDLGAQLAKEILAQAGASA
jgi:hydroxymethylbilane synthase